MKTRTMKRSLTLWATVLSLGAALAQSTTVPPFPTGPRVAPDDKVAPTGPTPPWPVPTTPSPLPAGADVCPLPRQVHLKPTKFQNWAGLYQDRVVLKLVDDLAVEPTWTSAGPAFKALQPGTVNAVELQALNATLAGVKRGLARQNQSVKLETLAKWRAEGEARTCERLADLSQYYRLYLSPQDDLESVVTKLNASKLVEVAYLPPIPRDAADPAPTTPPYEQNQGYLEATSTGGVGARDAWLAPGARGAGLRVIDIELVWNFNHEDLPKPFWVSSIPLLSEISTAIGVSMGDAGRSVHHGTAVIGEMVALDDKKGVLGITPEAEWGAASVVRVLPAIFNDNFLSGPVGGAHEAIVSDAILESQDHLRRGDVILIEQHSPGPESPWCPPWDTEPCAQLGYVPMEYFGDVFDAIKQSTALGTIVVEAAGNGNVDLDNPRYWWAFDRKWRDSGAIIVGGTNGQTPIQPNGTSNSGSRVDVSGWGARVMTTGYGDIAVNGPNDANQFYATGFNGTSSASPMVASAVLAIQGAMIASEHGILTPRQVRALLTETGRAQTAELNRPIGPLVSISGALAALDTGTASAGGIGGWDYNLRCPDDLALIGIKGRAGGLVDRVQGICGTISGGQQMTSWAGGPFGFDYEERCPAGKVVVGLGGRAGAFIDSLSLRCGDPLNRGQVDVLPRVGGSGGWTFGPTFCPRNRSAVGLRGTASMWLHRVQLTCAEIDHTPLTSWTSARVGGTGGSSRSLRCNAGEVLVGVRAREGWVVDKLESRCVRVDAAGNWVGSVVTRGSVGGGFGGGTQRTIECANGQAVSGISGNAGWYVDKLTLRCRDLTGPQQLSGASSVAGTVGGTGGDPFDRIDCPSNLPARGFAATGAGVVDSLKLVCGQ